MLKMREKADEGLLLLKIHRFKSAWELPLLPALLHEEMIPAVSFHHDLAGTGLPDPLFSAAVGLHLRHSRGMVRENKGERKEKDYFLAFTITMY